MISSNYQNYSRSKKTTEIPITNYFENKYLFYLLKTNKKRVSFYRDTNFIYLLLFYFLVNLTS